MARGMTPRRPTAWEIQSDAEAVVVLHGLVETHPELRAEADQIVISVLQDVDRSVVADEVSWALEAVTTAEVGAGSGRQRHRYIDPGQASLDLLEAAVDPFLVRLRQLAGIGLSEAATEVGAGVLLGLAQASGGDECAIFFEPDFVVEHEALVVASMVELGLDVEGMATT